MVEGEFPLLVGLLHGGVVSVDALGPAELDAVPPDGGAKLGGTGLEGDGRHLGVHRISFLALVGRIILDFRNLCWLQPQLLQ